MEVKSILKKSKGKFMTSMPQAEVTAALQELSQGAYRLLTYYYSRNDGWKFNDDNMAKVLSTSRRMVKKYRKELIDTKYLLIQKGQVNVYFIGRLAVSQFLEDSYVADTAEPKDPVIGVN